MTRFSGLCIFMILTAASACQSHPAAARTPEAVTASDSALQPAAAPATHPTVQAPATPTTPPLPKNFSEYSSEILGKNERCVVGASTNDDGMDERAVVYVTKATNEGPAWVDMLNLPPHTYQSRATHCAFSGQALFVLLQSDTQPEQTLSQTMLRVVKLDPTTGTVQIQQDIQVPGAFSAWVDKGRGHFQWKNDALIVSGDRRPQSSSDQQTIFTLRLDSHLKLVE